MKAKWLLVVALAAGAAGGAALAEEGAAQPAPSEPAEAPAESPKEEKKAIFIPIIDMAALRRPGQQAGRGYGLQAAAPGARGITGQPWQPVAPTVSFYDPVNGYYYYPGVRPSTVTITVGPADNPTAVYYLEQGQAGLLSADYYRALLAQVGQARRETPGEAAAPQAQERAAARPPAQPAKEAEFGSRLAPMLGGQGRASLEFALGEAKLREGKFEEAVKAFRQATTAAPGDPVPRMALCLALMGQAQYEVAARVLRGAVPAVSDWGKVRLDAGVAFGGAAAYQRVQDALRAAAGQDPTDGDLWLLMGFQCLATGCSAEAAEALQRGADVRPQDLALRSLLKAAQSAGAGPSAGSEKRGVGGP
jgi:tetratricopeptide (TPR) repeat protein